MTGLPKILPTLFVHLKDPASGERLFATRKVEVEGVEKNEPVRVGVWVYTPGSKIFRTASNMNATENIKAGKKELSGAKLDEQQVALLARTTFKLEGFEIEGSTTPSVEALKKWYDNEENVAYREQIADEQADLGKSSSTSSKA